MKHSHIYSHIIVFTLLLLSFLFNPLDLKMAISNPMQLIFPSFSSLGFFYLLRQKYSNTIQLIWLNSISCHLLDYRLFIQTVWNRYMFRFFSPLCYQFWPDETSALNFNTEEETHTSLNILLLLSTFKQSCPFWNYISNLVGNLWFNELSSATKWA